MLSCSSSVIQSVKDLQDSLSITKQGFQKKNEVFGVQKCMIEVLNTNYFNAKKGGVVLKLNALENMPAKLIGDKERIV